MSAEDQALIASLRSVPRGERHRLREASEEEIYEDWRMKPAREKMVKAGRNMRRRSGRPGAFAAVAGIGGVLERSRG